MGSMYMYIYKLHTFTSFPVQVCSNPPEIPHSQISVNSLSLLLNTNGMFLDGQSVYYQCSSGYSLVNDQVRQLICKKGEWEGILPSCSK